MDFGSRDVIDRSTFQSDYKDSCAWQILNVTGVRALLPENDTDPFVVLQISMNFRRKRVFSSYILTLPCVFLAALTLMVFCLPADRPDRIGLCEYVCVTSRRRPSRPHRTV